MAALAACDLGIPADDAASRSFDRPTVRIVSVNATEGYEGKAVFRRALSESTLTDGIETSSSFEIVFDRFLWPRTITRQAVCLHPSTQTITRPEECTDPAQPFTQPEYNPVRRSVTYRLAPGARLKPATQYRLTVFAPATTEQAGMFAFDEAPLARRYAFDFTTRTTTDSAVDELAPSPERYCAARKCAQACSATQQTCRSACKTSCAGDADPKGCESDCNDGCAAIAEACKGDCGCLDGVECAQDGDLIGEIPYIFGSCAFAPCHAPRVDPDPALSAPPAMGLDLSSPAALTATAFGTTAHLSQSGEAAATPDASGNRFGRAMPLIDPSNPGNSFLLYKLLINRANYAEVQPTTTLDDEVGRLRAGAIPGLPMPPQMGPGSNAIGPDGDASERQLQLISDWIASGAVISCE